MLKLSKMCIVAGAIILTNAGLGFAPALQAQEKAENSFKADIADIDAQIEKGVKYLISRANEDGSIGAKEAPNPGITGLAVLAVCKTSLKNANRATLDKAADFILKGKDPKDNSYGGAFKKLSNYFTSVAIMALASLDKEKYKDEVAKTTTYLKSSQTSEDEGTFTKKDWQYGGFNYNEKGEKAPDLNNTGFALSALNAAELKKDDEAWKRAIVFLQRVHNAPEVSDLEKVKPGTKLINDGGAMYFPGNTKGEEIKNTDGTFSYPSYGSMTYQLMQSYLFAGIPKDDKRVKETMRYVSNNFTLETNPGLPEKQAKEGLFNYYRIMAEALNALGDQKVETAKGKRIVWAQELSKHLKGLQKENGSWVNSQSERWMEGNPDLTTAYCVLALVACRDNLSK
jgi:squalene-hopene/tetraprenyl-beta-curcumene cyclase